MADTRKLYEWWEGDKKTQRISLDAVSEVIGKWDMLVHLCCVYGQKEIPEYFEYGAVSLETFDKDLTGTNITPQEFDSFNAAAKFIQGNSRFFTSAYILNPRGSTKVYVYPIYDIWLLQQFLIQSLKSRGEFETILYEISQEPWSVWDHHSVRKPEFIWRDDDGSKLPSQYIESVSGNSGKYIIPPYSWQQETTSIPLITFPQKKNIKR
jgi:hypothetical protein